MLLLLLVIIAAIWLFSYAGPRYYPAYTTRYSHYPLWGGRSHVLLIILALLVVLWLLGYIHIGGLNSPINRRHTGPIINVR